MIWTFFLKRTAGTKENCTQSKSKNRDALKAQSIIARSNEELDERRISGFLTLVTDGGGKNFKD